MPQRGVTTEYPAILKLYSYNSGYLATCLRSYVAGGYPAHPNSNSNPKWLRGYGPTQLNLTVTLTPSGYVAT